ncbi:PREDICTED: uncharacterized protein LOC100639804 [Amphimedon queenslandica]|uniref:ISXO2-like transposase domain-containing protein n=2 Tax=Amphimedon queenslandica TaxID=400682 RepID=A0AAN0K2G4_AMPQE|nr:PREDICTED: uncharacterized protein LOC100639804 [Amphimedon queenslandica]|eukprot:XP_019863338.1 PREDICTED: uncharacterized protein LOC100639804 [Amphimedon queenslandica]
MRERPRAQAGSDGKCWYCPTCKTTRSIRHGSFFSQSKITLQKWMILMLWWSREYPVTDASREAEVNPDTAVDVYGWLRDVCSTKLISVPIVLGGPGKVVQIDESLFRHKPKHHRGRATRQELWVFGMVDTSFQPSLGFMQLVPNRQAATLYPIIQAHVANGTTVYSNEWSAYRQVASLPQVAAHQMVNHSVNFVDPATGVHTQNIESYWSRAKRKLKRMKGCHAEQLPSYLDEFMWRERYGPSARDVWFNIMHHISEQYPV